MSGMLTILTAAVLPFPPLPPAITPDVVTLPIIEAACHIVDPEGYSSELSLRQSGGRGYWWKQSNGGRSPNITATKIAILKDDRSVLKDVEFFPVGRGAWPGEISGRQREGGGVWIETTRTDANGKAAILLKVLRATSYEHYVGFCDVKKKLQSPLSDAEAEEVDRK